jgi:hypothetical protein
MIVCIVTISVGGNGQQEKETQGIYLLLAVLFALSTGLIFALDGLHIYYVM